MLRTDGLYVHSSIQGRSLYRFGEDGTVVEAHISYNEPLSKAKVLVAPELKAPTTIKPGAATLAIPVAIEGARVRWMRQLGWGQEFRDATLAGDRLVVESRESGAEKVERSEHTFIPLAEAIAEKKAPTRPVATGEAPPATPLPGMAMLHDWHWEPIESGSGEPVSPDEIIVFEQFRYYDNHRLSSGRSLMYPRNHAIGGALEHVGDVVRSWRP